MKILIAEDDPASARLLELNLQKTGHSLEIAVNGRLAFEAMKKTAFDCLLTDWMMPEMDGLELIRQVRKSIKPSPSIIMLTAISSPEARAHALDSGADAFIVKPYTAEEVLRALQNVHDRYHQPEPKIPVIAPPPVVKVLPPYVGVVIATSTGGPEALRRAFATQKIPANAVYFLIQHAPKWMLDTYAESLQQSMNFPISLARHQQMPEAGHAYLTPGDCHLVIHPQTHMMMLDNGPEENFVKPAADPLFRSAGKAFGKYCLGVVMTGMGRDGAAGAAHIRSAGGFVFAQDPKEAVAQSMPKTVISTGQANRVLSLDEMGTAVFEHARKLAQDLERARS